MNDKGKQHDQKEKKKWQTPGKRGHKRWGRSSPFPEGKGESGRAGCWLLCQLFHQHRGEGLCTGPCSPTPALPLRYLGMPSSPAPKGSNPTDQWTYHSLACLQVASQPPCIDKNDTSTGGALWAPFVTLVQGCFKHPGALPIKPNLLTADFHVALLGLAAK